MSPLSPKIKSIGWGILVVLTAWVVAAPAVALPNIYDTLLHTQLADDLTLGSVWIPNDKFGFYRPLVFLPFILMQDLLGGYPAWLLQLLNVSQHAINAALLFALWKRERKEPLGPAVVGLLFAGYPFAYQALAIYGNNAYLTVTGFILLGLHARKTPWKLAFVQLLAFWVHETAVLLLPLAVGLDLLNGWQKDRRPLAWRKWLLPAAVWIGYLIVYLFLPRGGGPLLDYGGNDPWIKFLLFAQTLSYPIAWFAHLLPIPAITTIFIGLGVVVFLAIFAWHHDNVSLLFGFGWWLMASAVVAITLPTYYIADGARLLYPAAAGLALIWFALIDSIRPYITRNGVLVATVLILLAGGNFVHRMLRFYALGSEPVRPIVATLNENPAETLVWVNPVQWVSPANNVFPVGTEFTPIMGDHLFAIELLRANGVETLPNRIEVLHVPDKLIQTPFNYGLYRVNEVPDTRWASKTAIFETTYSEEGINTAHIGSSGSPSAEPLANFGPYSLLNVDVQSCETPLTVNFEIALNESIPPNAVFFVQLLNSDGALISQADGPPFRLPAGRVTLTPGESIWTDQRSLPYDPSQSPGQILFGLYDAATGERFPIDNVSEFDLIDNALWIPTDC